MIRTSRLLLFARAPGEFCLAFSRVVVQRQYAAEPSIIPDPALPRLPSEPRPPPRLNFVVQHLLVSKEALVGCFVAMSFPGSVVEVCGD